MILLELYMYPRWGEDSVKNRYIWWEYSWRWGSAALMIMPPIEWPIKLRRKFGFPYCVSDMKFLTSSASFLPMALMSSSVDSSFAFEQRIRWWG